MKKNKRKKLKQKQSQPSEQPKPKRLKLVEWLILRNLKKIVKDRHEKRDLTSVTKPQTEQN